MTQENIIEKSIEYKICTKCLEEKKISEFSSSLYRCKQCYNMIKKSYDDKVRNIIIDCECGLKVKKLCLFSHKKSRIHAKLIDVKKCYENSIIAF